MPPRRPRAPGRPAAGAGLAGLDDAAVHKRLGPRIVIVIVSKLFHEIFVHYGGLGIVPLRGERRAAGQGR